jgi:ribonucleotide monophosphatase NagD (HAD superfamily)
VVVGDQVGTDIRGAVECGIDSALILTGVSRLEVLDAGADCRPTYILESLALRERAGENESEP